MITGPSPAIHRRPAARQPATWPLLLIAAIATRALALGNPILHVDEQFYFTLAHGWAQGGVPYVDIWDRKPIGLFLIYLPAAHLPLYAGVWAYQLLALASAFATALIAASMARKAGAAGNGVAAGLLYLVWIILAEGQGGQSPIFYNLLVAGAAWLVLEGNGGRPVTRTRALLAMLLFGLALQVKPNVVFEGVFFGLWILWRRHRAGDGLAALFALAAPMVALALMPTVAAIAGYAAIGRLDAWLFANITSIQHRQPDPMAEQLGNLAGLVAILSPLVAMAIVALMRARQWRQPARAMLIGWLATAIAGVLLFGTWFDHYGLPVMVPASIAAAALFRGERQKVSWPMIALVVAAIGGQILLAEKRWERGTPAQFARVAAVIGEGPGCLYVYAGDPILYAATHRCAPTRFQFPGHLTRGRETGAIGVDQAQEIARILATRPEVIVDSGKFRGELPARRAQLMQALARDYVLAAHLPEGRSMVSIYRLRSAD